MLLLSSQGCISHQELSRILSINHTYDEIWFTKSYTVDSREYVRRSVPEGEQGDAGYVLR